MTAADAQVAADQAAASANVYAIALVAFVVVGLAGLALYGFLQSRASRQSQERLADREVYMAEYDAIAFDWPARPGAPR